MASLDASCEFIRMDAINNLISHITASRRSLPSTGPIPANLTFPLGFVCFAYLATPHLVIVRIALLVCLPSICSERCHLAVADARTRAVQAVQTPCNEPYYYGPMISST